MLLIRTITSFINYELAMPNKDLPNELIKLRNSIISVLLQCDYSIKDAEQIADDITEYYYRKQNDAVELINEDEKP